ncbi:hypothetical protein ATK30_3879 [Amycolatopsis echigonensis]|uniref:PE family protein n=1 Tax=Amycolatopsis echigonensis TaxID=2576905 RepID=A0A2N3WGQ1_9PSEU|nr:hypothetical protein [Amycolatopsis niigatensis]PKV93042.1 hypothetical protein ATK30_3879 [Amycolatopsis niigatensis]
MPEGSPASGGNPGVQVPPVPPIMVGSYGKAGGYKFTEDEVDSVIGQWKDLLTDLMKDERLAHSVATVQPPADEVASHTFVNQGANPSGQSLMDEHAKMVQYTKNFIDALTAAKQKISVDELHRTQELQKQGQSDF